MEPPLLTPHEQQVLAQRFQLIQFDHRGTGFSTRNLPAGLTPTDFLQDFEAVVDHIGVRPFLIWGWAATCHQAIR
jgi:pimeloyl-ACP methyl ester carboxylesterase